METIVKEGKELESIITSICEENNITNNDFYYSYNNKKSGLFSKNLVEVKAILKKDLLDYIKNYLEELLTNMGLEVKFETKIRDNVLYIKIYTNKNPIIIGRGGNTLKSLENIVKQKVNTEFNIHPFINLDVENYREKQDRRIERLAKNLAKDAIKTKTEIRMENMNAYDRRLVHNILSNFKGISTKSEGEEPNRHIVIKPE